MIRAKLENKDLIEFYDDRPLGQDEPEVDFGVLHFQRGPIKENGVNGITNEAVLEGLIARTRVLNEEFPCRENSLAVTKMEEALMWLNRRTEDRIERGVEGRNKA